MESKFEHSALEQDIERLAGDIKERKIIGAVEQKRAIKESLGQVIKLAPISSQPASRTQSSVLPSYLQDAPDIIKLKVEKLLDLAWHKGILAAANQAKKGDPLILDAFHDAVTDKLYEELKKRGHLR